MGPTKGRLFKLDFSSAKFWVKIFVGWLGLRAKRPPPLFLPKPEKQAGGLAYSAWASTGDKISAVLIWKVETRGGWPPVCAGLMLDR